MEFDGRGPNDLPQGGSKDKRVIMVSAAETNPETTLRLKDMALSCRSHFRKLCELEDIDAVAEKSTDFWASQQFTEFEVWCSKVGVDRPGAGSLDMRLKDVPELCSMFDHLLSALEGSLVELENPRTEATMVTHVVGGGIGDSVSDGGGKDDNPKDEGSDSSSSLSFDSLSSLDKSEGQETQLDPALKRKAALRERAEDTINRLRDHALGLSKLSVQHRQQRLALYRQKEEPKMAFDGFKRIAKHRANENFKLASENMKERMAESFARRRIKFSYIEQHRRKLQKQSLVPDQLDIPPKPPEEDGDPGEGIPTERPEFKNTPEPMQVLIRPLPTDQRTTLSATEITELKPLPPAPKSQRAESVASVLVRDPDFPPAPRVIGDTFECPYCHVDLVAHDAKAKPWFRHLLQDFEPYFCTVDNCNDPFGFPNTFDGLMAHLQSHVPFKYHLDTPNGEHMEFDRESEFENQVREFHGGDLFDEVFLDKLKKSSLRRGIFMFRSCPFCGGFPDDLEKAGYDDPTKATCQTQLRRHIDLHMQRLIKFLPPFREDLVRNDMAKNGSAEVNGIRSDNDAADPKVDLGETECEQEGCSCHYDADQFPGPPDIDAEGDFWREMAGLYSDAKGAHNRSEVPTAEFLKRRGLQLHDIIAARGPQGGTSTKRPPAAAFDDALERLRESDDPMLDAHDSLLVESRWAEAEVFGRVGGDGPPQPSGDPLLIVWQSQKQAQEQTPRFTPSKPQELEIETSSSKEGTVTSDPDYDLLSRSASDGLTTIIRRSRIPSYRGETYGYLPFAVLRRIMTPERIRKALKEECGITERQVIERLCAEIVPAGLPSNPRRWCADAPNSGRSHLETPAGYLTVFALLLEIDRGDLIGHFIDQGLSDHKLPLKIKECRNQNLQLAGIKKPEAVAVGHWLNHINVKILRSEQWFFFTPFFDCEQDGTPKHYDLPIEAQLPWRQLGKKDGKGWPTSNAGHYQGSAWSRQGDLGAKELAGGFGTVEIVMIDPDSHGFHRLLQRLSLPNQWFTIKSFRKADVIKYKEIDNLTRFSGRSHESLVTLLATFTHSDQYSLIFPCADCDLEQYWKRHGSPTKTPKFALWVSAQILGLTGAIHTIHNPPSIFLGDPERKYGRHGDLKPENILFYRLTDDEKAPGKLVITGFGFAEVHKKELGYTRTWAPPECDMKGNINALWDIWSLGCIFLEMACWMLGDDKKTGQERLDEFTRKRFRQPDLLLTNVDRFYDITSPDEKGLYGFKVKDEVVRCIEDMHKDPCCTQFLHELLDLVYDHMLVAGSPPKLGRIRSKDLLTKVQSMHRKAQGPGGAIYLTVHKRWDGDCVKERPLVRAALDEQLQKMVDSLKNSPAVSASQGSTRHNDSGTEVYSWSQGQA